MAHPGTEDRHPGAEGLHARPAADALATLLDAQIAALGALRPALPALERAADAAARALQTGGRLEYAGAGSSGLMALADLDRAALGPGNALLCLSASGRTPCAQAIAQAARDRGVTVVGLANMAGSPLLALADLPVLIETGPEVIAGSTRMGAATVQKVALNLLSVLVGIRLGHVHDGYMVNLIADNAKLTDRAARIVTALARVPRAMAEAALQQTGGAVKPVVLVAPRPDCRCRPCGAGPERRTSFHRDRLNQATGPGRGPPTGRRP